MVCAVLNGVGKHRVSRYRKNIGLWVFERGVKGDVFGCKERVVAGD